MAPLGYDHAPGAPVGLGPESTSSSWFPNDAIPAPGVNDGGYAFDGFTGFGVTNVHPILRYGRLGTVDVPGNISTLAEIDNKESESQVMGYLLPGRYRATAPGALAVCSIWSGWSITAISWRAKCRSVSSVCLSWRWC